MKWIPPFLPVHRGRGGMLTDGDIFTGIVVSRFDGFMLYYSGILKAVVLLFFVCLQAGKTVVHYNV
jgi:hypothetical protein